MKRILFLIVFIFVGIIIVQFVNQLTANEAMTLEGHLVSVEGNHYLISDTDFNKEAADRLTSDEILTFKHVYLLDHIPFSFKSFKNGDKVKVYHSGDILESHPAQVSVLKIEKKDD